MLKTYQLKTNCKGDSLSSKTAKYHFARIHDKTSASEGARGGGSAPLLLFEPPCNSMSPLIESIRCYFYFMPK